MIETEASLYGCKMLGMRSQNKSFLKWMVQVQAPGKQPPWFEIKLQLPAGPASNKLWTGLFGRICDQP